MTTPLLDILEGLAVADADAVFSLGTPTVLATGTVLFDLGTPAEHLYLVQRGRINLTLPMEVGGQHRDVLVEERQPGQMLGWSALVPPHRFTLKAVAPLESTVVTIPRAELLQLFAWRPEIGYQVMRNVSAVIGQRLQVLQAMWLREMGRLVEHRYASERA
jgi:CRP/FNR family transcriptional regulator, cyclic AMP receptor protein